METVCGCEPGKSPNVWHQVVRATPLLNFRRKPDDVPRRRRRVCRVSEDLDFALPSTRKRRGIPSRHRNNVAPYCFFVATRGYFVSIRDEAFSERRASPEVGSYAAPPPRKNYVRCHAELRTAGAPPACAPASRQLKPSLHICSEWSSARRRRVR